MNLLLLTEKDFISENIVIIYGRRFEHIKNVYRSETGDKIPVGLLNKNTGIGIIRRFFNNSHNRDSVEIEVFLTGKPPDPARVQIVLAMPRPKALNRIIQHITSLGIKRIYIIKTWKVEKSFWSSPVLSKENLFRQMVLGLEQAKDTILPELVIKKFFKPFVEDDVPDILKDSSAIVAHPYCNRKFNSIAGNVTLAIGPDGGFIPYEIEMLEKKGFVSYNFGARIMRVETAVPAILGRILL